VLAPTFRTPLAGRYRERGGAWDRPSLDELLTRTASVELADRVAVVAGGLRDLGVNAGDAVAWQSANRDEVAVLYRACWRLGAVAAPLHHQLGVREVERARQAVAPKVIVADLDALPQGPPV
jgi:long-subunit acyl-CoA synthetase (AMP-forming)